MLMLTKGQDQIGNFVKKCFGYISWTNDLILMTFTNMITIDKMLKLTQCQSQKVKVQGQICNFVKETCFDYSIAFIDQINTWSTFTCKHEQESKLPHCCPWPIGLTLWSWCRRSGIQTPTGAQTPPLHQLFLSTTWFRGYFYFHIISYT